MEQVAAGMFWLSLKFQESRVLPGGVELWNAGISGHARQQAVDCQQAGGLPAGGWIVELGRSDDIGSG